MGESVVLVNPAYETAIELKKLLDKEGLAFEGEPDFEKYRFFVSDDPIRFREFATTILPCDVGETKQIRIEEY